MNTIEVLREYCKRREEEIVTRRLACVDYDDRAAVSVDELRCLLNEIDRLAAESDLFRARSSAWKSLAKLRRTHAGLLAKALNFSETCRAQLDSELATLREATRRRNTSVELPENGWVLGRSGKPTARPTWEAMMLWGDCWCDANGGAVAPPVEWLSMPEGDSNG